MMTPYDRKGRSVQALRVGDGQMGGCHYIPTRPHWNEMYVKNFDLPYWTPEAKVPIGKIRIDRKRLAFDRPVAKSDVSQMVANFDPEVWMPITVDRDYCLVDGQHRLAVARELGLRFIDVVIENRDLLKGEAH